MRALFSLLLTFIVLSSAPLQAQEKYVVTSSGRLNVRFQASTDAPVIGSCNCGDTLLVLGKSDGWATIRYNDKYGYVSTRYIQACSDEESGSWFERIGFDSGLPAFMWMQDIMFVLTVVLSVLLFLCARIYGKKSNDYTSSKSGFYVVGTLMIVTCICQYSYSKMVDNAVWFCMSDNVGWFMAVVDFLLFGAVVVQQCFCFLSLIAAANYHGNRNDVHYKWSLLWAIPAGFVAIPLCLWLYEPGASFILGAFIAVQLFQLGWIVWSGIRNGSSVFNILFSIVLYVVGLVGCLLILIHFLALLIVVLLAVFLLSVIGESSSSSRCGSCRSYSSGYCYYRQQTVSSGSSCSHYES